MVPQRKSSYNFHLSGEEMSDINNVSAHPMTYAAPLWSQLLSISLSPSILFISEVCRVLQMASPFQAFVPLQLLFSQPGMSAGLSFIRLYNSS